jgi:hypothetical protein
MLLKGYRKVISEPAVVVHVCNPSSREGRRLALGKSKRYYLKNKLRQKGQGSMPEVVQHFSSKHKP